MVVGHAGIPDEVFELGTFQVAWHHLAPGEGAKSVGVAYLSAEFHEGYRGFKIVWVRQMVSLDLNRVERIGTRQTDPATALRPYDATVQCPPTAR